MTAPTANTENSLTTMLVAWRASQEGIQAGAFNALIETCYAQLRRIAAKRVRELVYARAAPLLMLGRVFYLPHSSDDPLVPR